jgi:hypothetical protein
MAAGILGLIAVTLFAVIIAAPLVSRRLNRVNQGAGAAVVPPARTRPAGGMAVPVITDLRDERQAFAYDNGLAVEEPEEAST